MNKKGKIISVICLCLVLFVSGCAKTKTTSIVTDKGPDEFLTPEVKKDEIDIPLRKGGVITLKLGYSTNNEDPRAIVSEQFKKSVEEKTKGTVRVEIYGNAELGSDAELISQVMNGKVDMTISSAGNFSNYVMEEGVSALPFMFDSFEEAWHFMDSVIVQKIDEELIDYNIRVLAHFDNGFRCVTTSDVKISTVEDMKDLVIRTPNNPIIKETMSELGARPITLDFSKLKAALAEKKFDGQENPIPIIYNSKLYEEQNYIAITNHSYDAMPFVISDLTWQMLTKEEQKIIMQAATDAQLQNREMVKKQTEEYLDKLENECNMQISYPDLTTFKEKTSGVADFFCYDKEFMKSINDFLDKSK